jgi:hypothetical protein
MITGMAQGAHTVQRLDAIAIGQHHIGDQRGKAALGQQAVALGDAVAAIDVKALRLQRGGDHDGDGFVIFDQQNVHQAPITLCPAS